MSKYLGVSLPTVVNWINAGRLEAHRTAGGHRRIARADLIAFSKSADMPLPPEVLDPDPARKKRVLLVDENTDYAEGLRDFLQIRGNLEVTLADNAFDAGFSLGRGEPDLVLVALSMPDLDVMAMRERLREDEAFKSMAVVAYSSSDDLPTEVASVFDAVLERPMTLETLWGQVSRRLGLSG